MRGVIQPVVVSPAPSLPITLLGGVVATVLVSAWLNLAPIVGMPLIDVSATIGGVLTTTASAAFWIGYAVFFVFASHVLAPSILAAWALLPGNELGIGGAFIKGATWGVVVWVLSGIVLGVGTWLNALRYATLPGYFALQQGIAAAFWLFAGCIAYGVTIALIGAMECGISVLDTLGWKGFYMASTGPKQLEAHRSLEPYKLEDMHPHQ
jgi:hypothetical protein